MSSPRPPGFATLLLHAGAGPVSGAAPVDLTLPGRGAATLSHPTVALLEERIAAVEGGVAAIATASLQAALHLGLTTLAGAGGHIVASSAVDGGAYHLLAHLLPRFGIATTFVDPRDLDAWRGAIRPTTRLLFGAALGPTGLEVLDIPAVSSLAHTHDLPLMVDASHVTPYLQRPFDLGADLLLHAAGGYLGGQGTATGGLLVDGGTFDWQAAHERSRRFATLCEPDDAFDGMVFSEESTVGAFSLRARLDGLPAFGAALGAQDASAILQGIDTLDLRMAQQLATTRRVAECLSAHPQVARVAYPALASHPDHALAKRILPQGCGAALAFSLKGDPAAACRFGGGLRIVAQGATVGGARTVLHQPAPGVLRLSLGLENTDDLIDDLKRGLKFAQKGA